MPTNVYGELNPLYPTYPDKNEELDELSRFFAFSYQPSSGYSGTAVFEIVDKDETFMLSLKCDPNKGVTASRALPENEDDISFHCTLPYDTFHDVFWGYTTARTLVMGGGCKIKNWRYKAAYNFGISFDMKSEKWVEYYNSGRSIKKMRSPDEIEAVGQSASLQMVEGIENVNARIKTQRITLHDYKSIGANLPTSAKDTQFMYEWEPSSNHTQEDKVRNASYPASDAWDMVKLQMDIWRNRQRNAITSNNEKHLSLWHNAMPSMSSWMFWKNESDDIANKYYHQLREYRANLTFNPVNVGRTLTEKWKVKVKESSAKIVNRTVEEYYGYYSQYTRHRIGSISSSIVNNSLRRFTSLMRTSMAETEISHFNLFNTTF